MKAKYIVALAILAVAFCMFALTPAEETDAASESYTEDVGAIPKGQPYTVTYTFGGSGYWNDTMKTAPSFSITAEASNNRTPLRGCARGNFYERVMFLIQLVFRRRTPPKIHLISSGNRLMA